MIGHIKDARSFLPLHKEERERRRRRRRNSSLLASFNRQKKLKKQPEVQPAIDRSDLQRQHVPMYYSIVPIQYVYISYVHRLLLLPLPMLGRSVSRPIFAV